MLRRGLQLACIVVALATAADGRARKGKQAKARAAAAGAGLRAGEEVCSGEERTMDVWAAANVTRVPASGWAEDTQVFEVVPGRRVMIVPASGWLPQTDCPDWIPIGAAKHLPVNTYKCDYPEEVGEVMLDVWWSDYSDAVKAAFGVVECEHRGPQNFGPSSANKRKHYVTVGNSDLAPDDLHADGCPTDKSHRGEAMWAPDCESATDECRQHITVLAYPHNTWALDWGGHTEWAARQCGAETSFCAPLYTEQPEHLPRQAQNKHGKS